MEQIKTTIKHLIELIGFSDFSIDLNTENRRLVIFINEGDWFKDWLPRLVSDLNQLSRVLAKKNNTPHFFVDVNNYRKERENIITELAKAAARKVITTKNEVRLPAMNAYERRLVHTELSIRPDVVTESLGDEPERCVIVKPLE